MARDVGSAMATAHAPAIAKSFTGFFGVMCLTPMMCRETRTGLPQTLTEWPLDIRVQHLSRNPEALWQNPKTFSTMKPGSTTSRKILSNPGFAGFSPLRLPHQGTRRVEGAGPSIVICTSVSIVLSDSQARAIWSVVELVFFRLIACWYLLVMARFHHERGAACVVKPVNCFTGDTAPVHQRGLGPETPSCQRFRAQAVSRQRLSDHLTSAPELSKV